MKLVIIVSFLACSYAAKLDRTYLPPPGAQTSGGSPGSLATPFGSSGSSGFGQSPNIQANQAAFRTQDQGGNQPAFPSNQGFGQGRNQFGAATQGAISNQPALDGPQGFDQNDGQDNITPEQEFDTENQRPERPQSESDRTAEILRYTNENDGETFNYSFETSNGISAEESGVATNGVQAQGAFAYTGDDGQMYSVTYTADENGYLPKGDHLPTPPPIPEEIMRSLEKNAQAAAAGTQEGAYNPEEDVTDPEQYNASNTPQQSLGPSQQYGAPASPFNALAPNQGPQINYARQTLTGAASGFAPSNINGPNSDRFSPSASITSGLTSSAPTGPAPARFAPSGSAQASPAKSGFTSSAPASFNPSRPVQDPSSRFGVTSAPQQYNRPSPSFKQQNSIPVQSQDESGYQYDQPQNGGSQGFRAVPSNGFRASPSNNAATFINPAGNGRSETPAYRAQSARTTFSNSNSGYQAQKASSPALNNAQPTQYNAGGNFQRPSAPVSKPSQYNARNNGFQASIPTSVSNNIQPSQYNSENNGFQASRPTTVSNNVQPSRYNPTNNGFQASRSTSVPNSVQPSQYNARLNVQRPTNNVQSSQYNAAANFQSSRPGQATPRMPEYQSAPYEYNPPRPQVQQRLQQNGNQGSGPFNPLATQTFNQGGQNQSLQNLRPKNQGLKNQGSQNQGRPSGQDFSGPLQQPSFSPEEGYKY